MSLVRKQCQGECQRVRMIPEHHSHCDKCWRKLMRRRRKEHLAEEYNRGFNDGMEAAREGTR